MIVMAIFFVPLSKVITFQPAVSNRYFLAAAETGSTRPRISAIETTTRSFRRSELSCFFES
jgi:hypothetical protein